MRAVTNLKICTLMCHFCRICLRQKSTDKLCVMRLKNDAKCGEELTCSLKNDMRNLTNFDPTF